MSNVLEYKGYLARIEYSVEDRVLYGKVEGIRDLVNFESDSIERIEEEFHCAVDNYLEMCDELGVCPDKAYSGTFNIRINPMLHRKIALKAFGSNETLNSAVEKAIEAYTDDEAFRTVKKIWNALSSYGEKVQNVGSAKYGNKQEMIYGFSSGSWVMRC